MVVTIQALTDKLDNDGLLSKTVFNINELSEGIGVLIYTIFLVASLQVNTVHAMELKLKLKKTFRS